MLDVSRVAAEAEVSRPTVTNWLEVYGVTHAIRVVRPFAGGGRREIIAQPKVYGFDTGIVCHARGWDRLRNEDCGVLWEHVVLESLVAAGIPRLHFWRDKQQREVDFVLPRRRDEVDAVECKWRPDAFETRGLSAFRAIYPKGRNFLVSPIEGLPYDKSVGRFKVSVLSPAHLGRLARR